MQRLEQIASSFRVSKRLLSIPTTVGPRLLECCVLASVPLSAEQQRQAQAAIEDGLRHLSEDVRAAAAAALHAFARAYMTGARHATHGPGYGMALY